LRAVWTCNSETGMHWLLVAAAALLLRP